MITRHFSCNKNITIAIPDNIIYYTSNDERMVWPNSYNFGASLVENTYTNGQGMMVFDVDVASIGSNAFYECTSLTNITCEAITPPTLGSGNGRSSVTAICVPAESVEAYKAADVWSSYADKIQSIP